MEFESTKPTESIVFDTVLELGDDLLGYEDKWMIIGLTSLDVYNSV